MTKQYNNFYILLNGSFWGFKTTTTAGLSKDIQFDYNSITTTSTLDYTMNDNSRYGSSVLKTKIPSQEYTIECRLISGTFEEREEKYRKFYDAWNQEMGKFLNDEEHTTLITFVSNETGMYKQEKLTRKTQHIILTSLEKEELDNNNIYNFTMNFFAPINIYNSGTMTRIHLNNGTSYHLDLKNQIPSPVNLEITYIGSIDNEILLNGERIKFIQIAGLDADIRTHGALILEYDYFKGKKVYFKNNKDIDGSKYLDSTSENFIALKSMFNEQITWKNIQGEIQIFSSDFM